MIQLGCLSRRPKCSTGVFQAAILQATDEQFSWLHGFLVCIMGVVMLLMGKDVCNLRQVKATPSYQVGKLAQQLSSVTSITLANIYRGIS